jgi:hypothetical protein
MESVSGGGSTTHEAGLAGLYRIAAEGIAMLYIGLIALIAGVSGAFYILFPELGALSHDVMTRPRGTWAEAPFLLAITPPLAGVIGIAVTREFPYGILSVLAIVCGSIVLIIALRSPVAPSISAGLLPMVLGVKSWGYPPAILFGTTLLALLSILWKRAANSTAEAAPHSMEDEIEDTLERSPTDYWAMVPLIAFIAVAALAVELTNLRFILFPPLAVIGFEMFGHPQVCPWAARPLFLPLACLLTAAGGLLILDVVGGNPLTAALSMGWGMIVLRAFDLHVPPALAVALLPMVMDHPTYAYPLSVGAGTLMLTLWFLGWKAIGRQQVVPT